MFLILLKLKKIKINIMSTIKKENNTICIYVFKYII